MWDWIGQHQFVIGVVGMYVFSAVTQALPQPQSSGGWYLFTYNLIHALAANFSSMRQMAMAPKATSPTVVPKSAGFVLLLLAMTLGVGSGVGCKSAAYRVHPGAVDVFDSQSYDSLLVAQATLAEAKSEAQSGALPKEAVAPLNAAIRAYDVAETAWQAYHAVGASAGTAGNVGNAGNVGAAQRVLLDALMAMTAAIGELKNVLPQQPGSSAGSAAGSAAASAAASAAVQTGGKQ